MSSAGAIMSASQAVGFCDATQGCFLRTQSVSRAIQSNFWFPQSFQRMTEVYFAPLACLDQVAGEALFGKALTERSSFI